MSGTAMGIAWAAALSEMLMANKKIKTPRLRRLCFGRLLEGSNESLIRLRKAWLNSKTKKSI
jgi:hypothetical protein